jgi:ribonuclease PH
MTRSDQRHPEQARPVRICTDYTKYAEGSVLIETGHTRVLCNASVENQTPVFVQGTNSGWITAEYNLLPRATSTRNQRERHHPSGRTMEIQRLIGRSLRAVTDLSALGERTIWIDCDVLQADGGTRTAAITGGFVALVLAIRKLQTDGAITTPHFPIRHQVAAISLGITDNGILVDPDYSEDRDANVDLNVVMTDSEHLIEVQGTAEKRPFSRTNLQQMLDLAFLGLQQHFSLQMNALGGKLE